MHMISQQPILGHLLQAHNVHTNGRLLITLKLNQNHVKNEYHSFVKSSFINLDKPVQG
jgi:hypothetical protein